MVAPFDGTVVDLPLKIAAMRTALNKGNNKEFFNQAHILKGIAANFSAGPLNRLALELEKMGINEDLSGADAVLTQVEHEAERLEEYCHKILKDFQRTT